jgi:tetratricopeptide (TPR) repeat protein
MKCRTKNSWTHLSFYGLLAVLLSGCLASAPSPAAETGAVERLNRLEREIGGSSVSRVPVEQRLKNLELKVFGKVGAGSMVSRLSSLEQFAGIKSPEHRMGPAVKAAGRSAEGAAVEPPASRLSRTFSEAAVLAQNLSVENDLREAISLHSQGRLLEAENILKSIVDRDPGNVDAFYSLGALAEKRGDLKGALEYYTLALQSSPADLEIKNAVSDLSRRVQVSGNGSSEETFVNPLSSSLQSPADLVRKGNTDEASRLPADSNSAAPQQQPPPAPASSPVQAKRSGAGSSAARALARAALRAALSRGMRQLVHF